MINNPMQDNGHPPSRQTEAEMMMKRRAFLKAFDGAGVSAARALELWQQADHQAEPETLIQQAIKTMHRDTNSETVHDEETPKVSSANQKSQVPPDGQRHSETQEQQPHGDFDIPQPDTRSTTKDTTHAASLSEEITFDETHPFDAVAENDNDEDWADAEEAEAQEPDNFPTDVLPPALQAPVKDWMRHLKMPGLLPVMCALGALSVALGRGVKAFSNVGKTFANIFALMGAESGTGKSLVYDAAMDPLVKIQTKLVKASKDINGRTHGQTRIR
jgi:hypothetical protein